MPPIQREYARHCSKRNIVLKARQVGISTYVAAKFFVHTITRPRHPDGPSGARSGQRAAEEIFRIVHRFQENLPERLRAGALGTSRANVRQLAFPQLDSEYRVETAGDASAGRGLTIHNLHCRGWPARPAMPPAHSPLCGPRSLHGARLCWSPRLTARGGCFYDEWTRAPQTGYVQHFFPWWWQPEYAVPGVAELEMTEQEHQLVCHYGLTAGQIAFRRELRSNLRSLALQEFAGRPHFVLSGLRRVRV